MELKSQNNSGTYLHTCAPQLPPLLPLRAHSSDTPLSGAGGEGLVEEAGLWGAPWERREVAQVPREGCEVLHDEDIPAPFLPVILSDLRGITMETNYTFTPSPQKRKNSQDNSAVTAGLRGWGWRGRGYMDNK